VPLISAILTAAGESTRMGRPKPLLPWRGVPLVEYQVASLVEAGAAEVIVVLGHRHELVVLHVKGPGVCHVLNPDYRQGKTTSIKTGLRHVDSGATGILLLAVDQPRPPGIIATVIAAHIQNDGLITSPRNQGHGGHPLLFSARLRDELRAITEEKQGIREVVQAHIGEINEVAIDDSIVRLDINSPEEYEEARERYTLNDV
jgi:molybdenum cofactor cytidylyltransferase